jgi:DNA modification methylase
METVYIPADQSQTELLKEQLRLAYGDEAGEAAEAIPVVEKECSGPDPARQALERKYRERLRERLDFGSLCTYVPNKKLPVFRWFKYKEGFSRALVERLLTEEWRLATDSVVFDPFAGSGTTLLACQQLGYRAFGTEVMPISVFVSRVKLQTDYDLGELTEGVRQVLSAPYTPGKRELPPVKIIALAFTPEIQDRLVFFRETIIQMPGVSEKTRNFLLLGLLSILEEVSTTSKDGQFLRLVERKAPPVELALAARYEEMRRDLQVEISLFGTVAATHPAEVAQGDARALPYGPEADGSVDAVITSPPYLNRYDYSRTYALELLLLFSEDFAALKQVRHSLLRSHIESRPAPTDDVHLPALDEILENIAPKRLNNPRIPIMIKGYFEDMNRVIQEMYRLAKPGARVALVVANARFEGELTPVDLLLSELAETVGFVTEQVWATRYKGNSSQQMGRFGRVPVHESIVFWRKRRSRWFAA